MYNAELFKGFNGFMNRRNFISVSLMTSAFIIHGKCNGTETVLRPEAFGAVGDGVAHDGLAIAKLVDFVNELKGEDEIILRFNGKYNLQGSPSVLMPPTWWNKNEGVVKGIPPLTRNNVSIMAHNSEFKVPSSFSFRRIKRGGDSRDNFFTGWQFLGDNCSFYGGVIDGSLDRRKIERGPKPLGFGGNEFGFVMEGKNWYLENVTIRNWGTDCIFIASGGLAKNCHFVGGRRNCVSIVAWNRIHENDPVIVSGGTVTDAAMWPEDSYNNPGAGMVVESSRNNPESTLIVKGVSFLNNRLKDLQLSKGAKNCIVEGNTFTNIVTMRPFQRGGHIIKSNDFHGEANIVLSKARKNNPSIMIKDNLHMLEPGKFVKRRHGKLPLEGVEQKIVLENNVYNKG